MRKEAELQKQKSQTSTSTEHIDDIVEETTSSSDSCSETDKMAEEREDVAVEQTIREHNAPPVDQQPLCIAAPTLTAPFELKSGPQGYTGQVPNFQNFLHRLIAPQQVLPQKSNVSLEDVVKSLASSMQSLEQQMSQIATSVSKLESQGKLPSQTETNPKHNVCAITLRSGKELKNAPAKHRRGHALESDAGRPFLSTSRTKIDIHEGTFSMEFDGNVVKFNTMRYPNLVSSVCKIDIVDPVLQETLELHQQDKSIEMLIDDVNLNHLQKPNVNSCNDEKVLHKLEILNSAFDNSSITDLSHSDTKSLTSVMQEPKFELKPPLEHLKFAYLGDEPYYSAKIYKDKTHGFYDQEIFRQQFVLGQKVFVDDSELIEIKSLHTGQIFKVNGHRLKPFYEGFQNITVEEIRLVESHLKLGSSQSPT
ncbi:uncharacterized protein G2W53_044789 [Senna tora]|uniref:Uncharacterized protein n=1 Tax=Senna tora TaxID=362788 RepID=A0A834SE79_9FABA|nr:uncharacterized protein G2W53_044789 [Senna tora]